MPDRLKRIIMYSVYIVIMLFIAIFVIALVTTMIQPSLFPNANIDGFKDMLTIITTILGVVSAFLAFYSLYASVQSTRELKQALRDAEDRLVAKVGLKITESYEHITQHTIRRGDGVDSVK